MQRVTLSCVLVLCWTSLGQAKTLDDIMLTKGKATLEILKNKGFTAEMNVGVLKFRTVIDAETKSDVGYLNHALAQRLEMALILAGSVNGHIGIIHNASRHASKIKGATHETPEGLEKLFSGEYPHVWRAKKVRPDAFLTGLIYPRENFAFRVEILLIRRGKPKPNEVICAFDVPAEIATLIESGTSFRTRGQFKEDLLGPKGANLRKKELAGRKPAISSAGEVLKNPKASHPASTKADREIIVRVFYGDERQRITFSNGKAMIAEPGEGERVWFEIERTDKTIDGPLGVVLKINGENTIEQERTRDLECRMWLLKPGDKYRIKGFLLPKGQKSKAFHVLSKVKSQTAVEQMLYGFEVGTISWTVFRTLDVPNDAVPAIQSISDLQVEALAEGMELPTTRSMKLGALRKSLHGATGESRSRGLIAGNPDKVIETPTTSHPFVPHPVPVLHSSVRYYPK